MSEAAAPPRATAWRLAGKATLLLAGLLAAGCVLRALPHTADTTLLDRFVTHQGAAGELLFVLAAAVGCAVGLPRQVACFLGGYAFGLGGGVALGMLAQVLGCLADFAWARYLAGDWAARRRSRPLRRIDRFLAAHPFRATLTLRLLPIGSNVVLNLLAGLSRVPLRPFVLASILGYLPQTVIFALLGGGVRVSHALQVGVGVALFAASIGLGLLLLRARRREISEAA